MLEQWLGLSRMCAVQNQTWYLMEPAFCGIHTDSTHVQHINSHSNTQLTAQFEGPAVFKQFSLQINTETTNLRRELLRIVSLQESFKKSLTGGLGWSDPFSFTDPLKKHLFWGWSWFGSVSSTNPSRKACWESGTGLKHDPLQILQEVCSGEMLEQCLLPFLHWTK